MSANKPASPLYSRVWQLAWPLILSNASIPLLGLVDNAILAHLSDSIYLAAVAVGTSLLAFISMSFAFLRMGTTALSAELEQGDRQQILVLQYGLSLAIILALVILLCSPLVIMLGLEFFQLQGQVGELAQSYIQIRLYSLPAVFMLYVLSGWFIGQQNSKVPVIILLSTNGLNITLDYLLVLQLGMASDGAAYASVCAEYTSLILALFLAYRHLAAANIKRLLFHWQKHWLNKMISINKDLFLRTLLLLSAFAVMTRQGNLISQDVVAANALLMQVILFASFALDGFAFACEAIAGQAKRQKNTLLLNNLIKIAFIYSAIFSALYAIFLLLMQTQLITLLSSIHGIQALLHQYWFWVVLIPILAMPSYIWDGVFIGCQKIKAMRNTMLISVALVFLPLIFIIAEKNNHLLWLAFAALSLSRSVSLGLVYFYKKQAL